MKRIKLLLKRVLVPLKKPKNYKDKEGAVFINNGLWQCSIDELFLFQYDNVSIDGQGLAFYKDYDKSKKMIHQVRTHSFIHMLYWKIRAFIHAFFSKDKTYKEALLVSDLDSHAYFHWIADVLPKLIIISENSDMLLKNIPIIFPEKVLKSYANESLEIFLQNRDIVLVPYRRKIKVKQLYFIPNIAQPAGSGNYRPDIMHVIRKKVLQHIAESRYTQRLQKKIGDKIHKGQPLRIYFSRKDAEYRYLKNEKAIVPLLKKYGFLFIEAGKFSFWEQALLSNWAEIILGVHGAALTNMIWMKSGSSVIEIRKENDAHNNCYFSLASAMELDYYYLFAKGDRNDTHTSNVYVDVDMLEKVLQEAM